MKQVRNTKQKQIIIDALKCADHPTASQLFESLHSQNPTISRATVFRVLAQYAESGSIKKISITDNDARFDARMAPHAHMFCADCGRVCDIFLSELDGLLSATQQKGYKIYSTELNFVGVCPDCVKNEVN
ncbi:MAG: transcriptional repressor [Clostridiales bacterium]|nr:transcriptional repressor [Clostridiales bacterium]